MLPVRHYQNLWTPQAPPSEEPYRIDYDLAENQVILVDQRDPTLVYPVTFQDDKFERPDCPISWKVHDWLATIATVGTYRFRRCFGLAPQLDQTYEPIWMVMVNDEIWFEHEDYRRVVDAMLVAKSARNETNIRIGKLWPVGTTSRARTIWSAYKVIKDFVSLPGVAANYWLPRKYPLEWTPYTRQTAYGAAPIRDIILDYQTQLENAEKYQEADNLNSKIAGPYLGVMRLSLLYRKCTISEDEIPYRKSVVQIK